MRRLDKLRFLSWQQRRVLLYAFLLINAIRLSLWLFPFGKIRRQLDVILAIWVCSEKVNSVSVDFIAWAISVAGFYALGEVKCLAKALTTQLLLNHYGYAYKLRIGVTKGKSQVLEAHAWIECQGRVVVGDLSDLSRFKPLSEVGAVT